MPNPAFRITDEMLLAAAKIADLDEALRSVMSEVGINEGGIAGVVFSGVAGERWSTASQLERVKMLDHWRDVEQAHNDPYLDEQVRRLHDLMVRYMARVIDCESTSFVEECLSHAGIEFEGDDLEFLQDVEERARLYLDAQYEKRRKK